MTQQSNVVALRTEAAAFSLTPASLGEAMELAKLIADSDLAPRDYKNKPGNVLIAVQMGAEVGLTPMAAIQTIAVINGRPSLFGDSGKAILLAAGCIIEEASAEQVRASGVARCKITRPGRPPVERTFSRDDAKAAGLLGKDGPWKLYSERMLAWRAFWFAARDSAADLLKGLHGAEEVRDIAPPAEKHMGAVEEVDRAAAVRGALAGRAPAPTGPAERPPTLDRVLLDIKAATTPDEMAKAGEACARLASAADKDIARDAYRDRMAALKAAAGGPSYAEIADKINAAQTAGELDIARDLARSVKSEEQRAELEGLAARRADELAAAGESA
jgi:hypothetical protein